jgi:predicted dehydrogenase
MKRRSFLKAAGMAGPGLTLMAGRRTVAAADKVTIAVIGMNGRGGGLANSFVELGDVNIAYLCDIDERVLAKAAKAAAGWAGQKPALSGDLRRALDDKAVDAVVIATPDHWHAPATLLACAAGKDVYVEKPCSHNLREGRWMVEAARRTGRIVQHGTQYRSFPVHYAAAEAIKAGKIGRALMAKAWDVQLRDDIGQRPDGPIPAGVDYDAWTGPAPMLPFNENRFHYKWHWNWNYGTGDVGNDGVHQIDIARWMLGVEAPRKVAGSGRKIFFADDQVTPDTANISFDYGEKSIIFEMRIWAPYGMEEQENGVAIYGSDGVMHIGRWQTAAGRRYGYRIYDRRHKLVSEELVNPENWHSRNFIDCVRSRQKPNAEIAIGHTSSLHAHLANIVIRTGRNLSFDPQTETIAADAAATRLLGRAYRRHWSTPRG